MSWFEIKIWPALRTCKPSIGASSSQKLPMALPTARKSRAAEHAPSEKEVVEPPEARHWKQVDWRKFREEIIIPLEYFRVDYLAALEDQSSGPRSWKPKDFEEQTIKWPQLWLALSWLRNLDGLDAGDDLQALKKFFPSAAFKRLRSGAAMVSRGFMGGEMLDLARYTINLVRRVVVAVTSDATLEAWGLKDLIGCSQDQLKEFEADAEAYKRFYLPPMEHLMDLLKFLACSEPVRRRLAADVTFLDAFAKFGLIASYLWDGMARWTTYRVLDVLASIVATDAKPWRIHAEVQRRRGLKPVVEKLFYVALRWDEELESFYDPDTGDQEPDDGGSNDGEDTGSGTESPNTSEAKSSPVEESETSSNWSMYRDWIGSETTMLWLELYLAMLAPVIGKGAVKKMANYEPLDGEWDDWRASLASRGRTPEGCDGPCTGKDAFCGFRTDLFGNPAMCDCCANDHRGISDKELRKELERLSRMEPVNITDPSKMVVCPKCKFARYCSERCRVLGWRFGHGERCTGFPTKRSGTK